MDDDLGKRLKEFDFSDPRLFVVALVLLIVPVFFFFVRFTSPAQPHLGTTGFRPGSSAPPRKGFGFIQSSAPAGTSAGTAAPVRSAFSSDKTEDEWSSAVSQTEAAVPVLDFPPGMPMETRLIMEAEYNNDLRTGMALFDQGSLREALPHFNALLKSENPYLQILGASNLCAAYQSLGMQNELEESFQKLAEILEKLPPGHGFSAKILEGLKSLSHFQSVLPKAALSPESQNILAGLIKGHGDKVSPDTISKSAVPTLQENIPGLDRFKDAR